MKGKGTANNGTDVGRSRLQRDTRVLLRLLTSGDSEERGQASRALFKAEFDSGHPSFPQLVGYRFRV